MFDGVALHSLAKEAVDQRRVVLQHHPIAGGLQGIGIVHSLVVQWVVACHYHQRRRQVAVVGGQQRRGQRAVGVLGAAGRMGRLVARAVAEDPGLALVAAIDRSHTGRTIGSLIGRPDVDVPVSDELDRLLEAQVEVAVDFTHPDVVMDDLTFCISHALHTVVGTSGFDEDRLTEVRRMLEREGGESNVIVAPNFALGAVLMQRFAAAAASVPEPLQAAIRRAVAQSRRFNELALREGEFRGGEFPRVTKNGQPIYLQGTYNPVLDLQGKPVSVVKFAQDITDSKLHALEMRAWIDAINVTQAVFSNRLLRRMSSGTSMPRGDIT